MLRVVDVCDEHIFQMEEPLFWRAITYTLLKKIRLLKNLIDFLKINYKLFLNSIINQVLTMMSLFSDALSVHL